MAMFTARGLNNFISELRSCPSHEEEQKRIDKELTKIRQKFTQQQALNSYDKKKYAWKLIYIYMLGYEIDFGHMQVVNLVAGTKYSEKCLGYLGCSILLKSSDELMTLVINCIRNDLKSPEACNQCLALCCVANLGGTEFSEALAPDVVNLLMGSSSVAHVRKKAALCAHRMLPPNPDLVPVEDLEARLKTLLSDNHLGVVTSAASLLMTALNLCPTAYRSLIEICVIRLSQLVVNKTCPRDYMYYNTPAPWLQVKLLRLLQQFGTIETPVLNDKLTDVLNRVLSRPAPGKGAKFNAAYAVLIETVNLVISQGKQADPKLKEMAVHLLARFISVSEPNIRYVGLDSMYRLVRLEGDASAIKEHKSTVLFSLKDADNSVRRRALDLLFSMCDTENALEIVGELVNYLTIAEGAIREEIVLKAAILAEKYAKDLRWYVDTVLQLITIAGSQVPDDVWHRVVQIVTNKEDLQKYTAEVMFRALEPPHVDETTTKFGAYVLGEFGYLICEAPEMSSEQQFAVLHKHFLVSLVPTKCLVLTAFVKMENLYDELRPKILDVFKKCLTNVDLEIQQRACEYLSLNHVTDDLMKKVLEPMPIFPENRESALIVRLRNQQKASSGQEGGGGADAAAASVAPSGSAHVGSTAEKEPDLISLDSPEKKAMPSVTSEAIRGPNPVADLLDVFGGGGAGGGSVVGVDPALESKLKEWSKNLLLNSQGVLFENDVVQLGVKQEFRGSQGRMNLFYGNKTAEAFSDFKVQVEQNPAFRMQVEEIATQLPTKQQVKQQILLESMAPYVSPPALKLSFTRNGVPHAYTLTLPCEALVFMEPVKLSADDFRKRWTALEGQDREQQEVVTAVHKIDMDQNRKWLTENIKFGLAEGMDATGNTSITCAGTFRTGATTPNGEKISVGCLVRVEANPTANSYRLTVRAVHKDISLAIKHGLRMVLL